MAMSDHVSNLTSHFQTIEALFNTKKSSNNRLNQKIQADPAGFEPAIPGLEGLIHGKKELLLTGIEQKPPIKKWLWKESGEGFSAHE